MGQTPQRYLGFNAQPSWHPPVEHQLKPQIEPRFSLEEDRSNLDRWEAESPSLRPRHESGAVEAQGGSAVDIAFADPRLQAQYERCLAEVDPSSSAVRHVCALVALLSWLKLLEGEHSPSVHETIDLLLLRHTRPELCRWLQSPPSAEASPVRDQLLHLVAQNQR